MKEHMTYTIQDGKYIGYFTNYPGVIVQVDSLFELKEKGDALLRIWLKEALVQLDRGIDVREVSLEDFCKFK